MIAGDGDGSSVRLVVAADPSELAGVRQATRQFARDNGLSEARSADLSLALTEACANAVVHAYPPARRRVRRADVLIDLTAGSDGIVVYVCDAGIGVDAPSDRRGLGLGVGLMHALADDVRVRSEVGRGTCVRMHFDWHRDAVLGE